MQAESTHKQKQVEVALEEKESELADSYAEAECLRLELDSVRKEAYARELSLESMRNRIEEKYVQDLACREEEARMKEEVSILIIILDLL